MNALSTIQTRQVAHRDVSDYARFDELGRGADALEASLSRLLQGRADLSRFWGRGGIREAQFAIARVSRAECENVVEACRAFIADFESVRSVGVGEAVPRSEIAKAVALVLGSFPNANVPDPDLFARMMIEEIEAARPSVLALESACRRLRREQKFLPAIAEVLSVLASEENRWRRRLEAISVVVQRHVELADAIEAAEARLLEECRDEERRHAAHVERQRAEIRTRIETGENCLGFPMDVVLKVKKAMRQELIAAGQDPAAFPGLERPYEREVADDWF